MDAFENIQYQNCQMGVDIWKWKDFTLKYFWIFSILKILNKPQKSKEFSKFIFSKPNIYLSWIKRFESLKHIQQHYVSRNNSNNFLNNSIFRSIFLFSQNHHILWGPLSKNIEFNDIWKSIWNLKIKYDVFWKLLRGYCVTLFFLHNTPNHPWKYNEFCYFFKNLFMIFLKKVIFYPYGSYKFIRYSCIFLNSYSFLNYSVFLEGWQKIYKVQSSQFNFFQRNDQKEAKRIN